MTSSPELLVPDAAVEMLSRTITAQLTLSATGHCVNTRDHDAVRDIAGPVVAAWAREVANDHQYEGGVVDVDHLRYLADAIERDHKERTR